MQAMWRYIQKIEKNQNLLQLHHCRMTLITTYVWKAVKFQLRKVETCVFHQWLELENLFNSIMNLNWIDEGKLASFANQSDQKSTFSQQPPFTPLTSHA